MNRSSPIHRTRIGRTQGFTLTELAITTAAVSLTIAFSLGILVSQQKSFHSAEVSRTLTESGRDGMLELEQSLRRAGFGVDPRHAFDFAYHGCLTGNLVSGLCRDRIDRPDSIVFMARDPRYRVDPNGTNGCGTEGGCPKGAAWKIEAKSTNVTSPTVTLVLRKEEVFHKGRVLLLTCHLGRQYTMATVATTTRAAAGSVRIPLAGRDLIGLPPDPTRENNFADDCYTRPGAFAFMVDRFHYFVRNYGGGQAIADAFDPLPPAPYLMLDTGLDLDEDGNTWIDSADEDDLLPIAPGIEDLQFTYVLNRRPAPSGNGPDLNGNWIVGDSPGLLEEPRRPPVLAGNLEPTYQTATDDASRFQSYPANIRMVRVTLGLRSTTTDPAPETSWLGDILAANENRLAVLDLKLIGERYRRTHLKSTIALQNMSSRSMFNF